jgi:hypothetical protein
MNQGTLWLMDTKQIDEQVRRAAHYVAAKYGIAPNLCLCNPKDLPPETDIKIDGVTLLPDRAILPGHLWIGTEDL